MQLGRKARTMEELVEDKTFLFHVGQLIGSAEMASHVMQNHMEGDIQRLGDKLAEASGWFFKESRSDSKTVSDKK
jgi:hypothetical protein